MYARWLKDGRSFDLGRMGLRDLLRAYASHPAVHLYVLLAFLCGILAFRWGVAPARAAVAVLATALAYPVVWYVLHRFVLHGRYLYRSPLTAAAWKRIHFDHHQDPHRMDVLFGSPATTLPPILLIAGPLGWLAGTIGQGGQGGGGPGGSAVAVGAALLITCAYEFTHCVQHLNYRPRSRLVRRMKELHLLHHFHDEMGNYGITSFAADRLLGTHYGSARERVRSPHAFNLGYTADEAVRYPWVARLSGRQPLDRPPPACGRPAHDRPVPAAAGRTG